MRVVIAEDHALLREGLVRPAEAPGSRSSPRPRTARACCGMSPGTIRNWRSSTYGCPRRSADEGLRAAIEARAATSRARHVDPAPSTSRPVYAAELLDSPGGGDRLSAQGAGRRRAGVPRRAATRRGWRHRARPRGRHRARPDALRHRQWPTGRTHRLTRANVRCSRLMAEGRRTPASPRRWSCHCPAPSRSTSRASSPSSTYPPPTTITGASSPYSPTCAGRAEPPVGRTALHPI